MKSLFFFLVLLACLALAIPTPARACNVSAVPAAQTVCQSSVSLALAPAFLVAPVAVQAVQFQAVQTCPSVSFAAQSYGVQSFAAQSYGDVTAATVAIERRSRIRGRFRGRGRGRGIGLGVNALGLGLGLGAETVALDPLTGLPVEVVDPLLEGFGGRFRGNAIGRRGRARGRRR